MCLPAEDLDVSRFAQHGQSDAMPPGPLLAEVVHALTGADGGGLAALSDDQLAAIAEFAARRSANQSPPGPARPAGSPPTSWTASWTSRNRAS